MLKQNGYLKKLVLSTTVLALVLGLGLHTAFSAKPIVVAIFDSPVDIAHPEIATLVDVDLMKNIKLTDLKGEEKTWYEINKEAKENFEKNLDQGLYNTQIEFLDASNRLIGNTVKKGNELKAFSAYFKGLIKYGLSPKFRHGLEVVGTYLHGTHVAGLAMRSLTDVRLITVPVITYKDKLKISQIWNFDAEKERAETKHLFQQLTTQLQDNDVRVVNLSLGINKSTALKSVLAQSNLFSKTFLRWKLKKMADQSSLVLIDEMQKWFEANPKTIFVMAAGNSGTDLAKTEYSTAKISGDNVIQVAALDDKGKLASFSERSSSFVEVAASGQGIVSALVGGGEIAMSGTSMSSPEVFNTITHIIEKNPDLTVGQTKDIFYRNFTEKNTELEKDVANGAALRDWTKLEPSRTVIVEVSKISDSDLQKIIFDESSKLVADKSQNPVLQIIFKRDGVTIATQNISYRLNQITNKIIVEAAAIQKPTGEICKTLADLAI